MMILMTAATMMIIINCLPSMIFMLSAITSVSIMMSMEYKSLTFNNFMQMDSLSSIMIILTLMSIMLIMVSTNSFSEINNMMFLIMIILIPTFLTSSFFLFYILFEMVLIPTLLLITKSGTQPERIQAGMYLIMYTVTASLPLLIGILWMKSSMNMIVSNTSCMMFKYELILILAFLVKMPMFLTHLWLPKAHVEAPLEGSMILAAILLKLGGYGLIRVIPLIMKISYMSNWVISISLIGASLTGMNCIRQKDLKALIAYSSVAHMGLILASLFTITMMGKKGAIIMMIAHGLSSSALFLLVNLTYSKFHTRNILSFSGMLISFPNTTFWWFMFTSVNISVPPSINMFSEIMMFMSMITWQPAIMMTLIIISSFMTAIFSINLFTNMIHNKPEIKIMENTNSKLFFSLMTHLYPLIFMSMKMEMFY